MTLEEIDEKLLEMDEKKKATEKIDKGLYERLENRAEKLGIEQRQKDAEDAHKRRIGGFERYAAPLRF